jgi:hypothetical protein
MGDGTESRGYGGFMESFDAAAHHVNAGAVRSRLEGSTRDETGRFRVAVGSSTLRKDEDKGEKGVSLAALEKQVRLEEIAKKQARKAGRSRTAEAAVAAEEVPADPQKRAKVESQTASWVRKGLVVKVLAREPPELFKSKGTVVGVAGDTAEVEFAVGTSSVRRSFTASALETVIPKPGGAVLVVGGPHAGAVGRLVGVVVDLFAAQVALDDGTALSLPYEQVCKTS